MFIPVFDEGGNAGFSILALYATLSFFHNHALETEVETLPEIQLIHLCIPEM